MSRTLSPCCLAGDRVHPPAEKEIDSNDDRTRFITRADAGLFRTAAVSQVVDLRDRRRWPWRSWQLRWWATCWVPCASRRVPWVSLGPPGTFPINETRLVTFQNPLGQPWDGMAAEMGVYVRNLGEDQFLVFAMNCAHLGCPVTWFPQSGLFLCPCHGGVYYENGDRASGPPTRGLFACTWRLKKGQLEIQAPHLPTLQDTLRDTDTNAKA